MQSRYYNPFFGRFVNTDDPENISIEQNALTCNTYACCYNDPVNETDYNGQIIASILEKIFFGILVGFLQQATIDIVEWVFAKYVIGKNVQFKTSNTEDYLTAILSAVVDQFKPSIKITTLIGALNIIAKYLTKMIRGKMVSNDWINLAIDVFALCLTEMLGRQLRKLERKIKQIRKLRWRNANSSSFRIPLKNVKIKIKYCGFAVNCAIPVSQQFASSLVNILCYAKK